jgi:hypothetical protein
LEKIYTHVHGSVQLLFYANITGLVHPSSTAYLHWVMFNVIGGHLMLLAMEILLAIRSKVNWLSTLSEAHDS